MRMLDAAVEYARRRMAVFPVWGIANGRCGCGVDCQSPGKHPISSCAPRGFQDARIDETIIRQWWTQYPTANIATPTSWAIVLDIDPRHGGDATLITLEQQHDALPDTATVFTGGGGRHLYFARPAVLIRNSAGKIGPGVDVRGEGGYVLLPPSAHISGGTYRDDVDRPLFETPLAPMPAWLVGLATATGTTNGQAPHRTSDEWAAMLIGAPEGQRREQALKIAGHYLGLGIAPGEVIAILLGYAGCCEPPFPEREAREIVHDLARRDRAKAPTRPAVEIPPDILQDDVRPPVAPPAATLQLPGGFISRYVEAALRRTDAPAVAHALTAVGVLSALTGPRVRLPLAYRSDGVRLGLWTMNLVDSTSGRKTTVLEFGIDVLRQVLGDLAILPWKGSPEALIQAMAARDHATAIFARDEYSGLLAQMKRGGYTAGLAQDFIRAYDGLPIVMARTAKMNRKTGERVDDTDRVHEPYLVKLCAATRTAFIETATIEDVLDGLLARFVFTSGSAEERRAQPMTSAIEEAWRGVVSLAHEFHGRAADLLRVNLPDAVLDQHWELERRYKADALEHPRPDAARPAMKRLAETVLKVSALLAIDRARDGIAIITPEDFDAAAALGGCWQATTLALIADIGRSRFQARADKVLATIRAHPRGIGKSALYRAHRDLQGREFEDVLAALELQRLVHKAEAKVPGKAGPIPMVYFPGPPPKES
jgi:hypothetical protein